MDEVVKFDKDLLKSWKIKKVPDQFYASGYFLLEK